MGHFRKSLADKFTLDEHSQVPEDKIMYNPIPLSVLNDLNEILFYLLNGKDGAIQETKLATPIMVYLTAFRLVWSCWPSNKEKQATRSPWRTTVYVG